MASIRILLDRLEDPFLMFPLQDVASRLSEVIDERSEVAAGRTDWYGSSQPSVEDEHDEEVMDLLIAAAFVLAQASITQTVSICTRIRELAGDPSCLPKDKLSLMNAESKQHGTSGISEIALINSIANYSKHRFQWSDDWSGATGVQKLTIEHVRVLGLEPQNPANLHLAVQSLGTSVRELRWLGDVVQEWREGLSRAFRGVLRAHGEQLPDGF